MAVEFFFVATFLLFFFSLIFFIEQKKKKRLFPKTREKFDAHAKILNKNIARALSFLGDHAYSGTVTLHEELVSPATKPVRSLGKALKDIHVGRKNIDGGKKVSNFLKKLGSDKG